MRLDSEDRLLNRMQHLPRIAGDGDRREEVRLRCRRALRENHRRRERRNAEPAVRGFVLDCRLAYGLCAAYFLGLIVDVLRLYVRD